MRYEGLGGRLGAGGRFAEGLADGRYHHGFHGGPILFLAIGLAIIFTAWAYRKKLKKRNSAINHFEMPILSADKPSAADFAPSAHRAAVLDEWEQTILKEAK